MKHQSMMYVYPILFVLVNSVHENVGQNCMSFNNIILKITTRGNNGLSAPYDVNTFSGCIESAAFTESIVDIAIIDQEVPSIEYKSIRNMPQLEGISFIGCEVVAISSEAFEDVPHLKQFQVRSANLREIVEGVFTGVPELEVINLDENDISLIGKNAFGNLPSLKQIIISHNDLKTLSNLWFTNSSNIEVLDFSHNQIEIILHSSFQETPYLKEIHLDFNEIATIESDIFKTFKHLKYLGLSHNRLTELKANMFPGKITIDTMLINANFLNFLPRQLREKLDVKTVTLEGNPWECRCLEEIHLWLNKLSSVLKITEYCVGSNIPECLYSTKDSRSCDETVDEELTDEYMTNLKALDPPLNELCARFD